MYRILYIDDDPALRDITREFLGAGGEFLIDTARSAEEGLQILGHQTYDAVVSDYQMPGGMDGMAFLRAVRARQDSIPFILFTGRGREEVVVEAYEAGVDAYCRRSGDPSDMFFDLANTIRQVVNRRRIEHELSLRTALLAAQQEVSPDGILVVGENGRILSYNQRFVRFWDLSEEVMATRSGADVLALAAPRLADPVSYARRVRHLLGDRCGTSHDEVRFRDGRTFDQYTAPMTGAGGEYYGRVWYFRDITEEKRTQEALVQSAEKYRDIIRNMQDVVYRTDRDGKLIMFSPHGVKLAGYASEEEMIGLDVAFDTYQDPRERERFLALLREKGTVENFPLILKSRTGKPRHVLASSHFYYDHAGNILGVEGILHDYTDRWEAEVALRESEKRYRDLFEINAAVMILIDPDTGRITDANAAACGYYGYTREEMQGLRITQINTQDPEKTGRDMAAALGSGGAVFRFRHRKKSGEVRDVEVFSGPVFFEGRKLLHSIIQDETERTRAEEELRESRVEYRDLVENLNDVILSLDCGGMFMYVSPVVERLYGYSPRELIGQHFLQFIHPDDRGDMAESFRQELAGKYSVIEFRILARDGSIHWISASPRPLERDGRITGFTYVMTDITDRKKAEVALRESEAKYRGIFNNANDSIEIHELREDGLPGRYIDVNDVACRMLGYTRGELLDMSPLDIVTAYHSIPLEELGRKFLSEGHAFFVTEHRSKDGEIVPVEVNAHVMTLSGKKVVLAVTRDITERRKREQAVRQSLEEKELLLKEIHHRVKNNLQTVSSLLYLQSLSSANEAHLSVLREARSRVTSMGLIHQKLYQSADIATIPFLDYIQSLIEFLSESYGINRDLIRIGIDIRPPDLSLDIDTGIPCGLIINELVTNALKYAFPGHTGGTIRIAIVQEGPEEYTLTVSDSGVGLPAGFDPAATETLGMALVTGLVGQLDGSLAIVPGPGTTVQIRFRAAGQFPVFPPSGEKGRAKDR